MRSGIHTKAWLIVVASLFLFVHAGLGGAVAGESKPYNPKDDPNYTPETSKKVPERGEAIRGLVKEYEGRAIPGVEGRPGTTQYAPTQPQGYTQEPPLADLRESVRDPLFGDAYAYPYYPYGYWYRWRWTGSPRIPWWSLIPFARDDDDKDFFPDKGHFQFGHHGSKKLH